MLFFYLIPLGIIYKSASVDFSFLPSLHGPLVSHSDSERYTNGFLEE